MGKFRCEREVSVVKLECLKQAKNGGWAIGFRKVDAFNKALVAKHGWRVVTINTLIWGDVIRGKYIPRTQVCSQGVKRKW